MYEGARTAVEKLDPTLEESEWTHLVNQGYAEEIEELLARDIPAAERCAQEAVTVVQEGRCVQPEGRQNHRSSKQGPRKKQRPRESQSANRHRVLSALLALEADLRPGVLRFRRASLEGRLLSFDEVEEWITARTEAEGPPVITVELRLPPETARSVNEQGEIVFDPPLQVERIPVGCPVSTRTKVLSYAVPGSDEAMSVLTGSGVLEDLRSLAARLAEAYRWDETQATVYVLTGITPLVSRIRVRASCDVRISSLSRLTLTVDPTCTPDQVAAVYQEARGKLLPTGNRLPSEKHLRLALFAAEKRREDVPWQMIMMEWNRELAGYFSGSTYSEVRNFTRDALAAQRRVSEPPMQVPFFSE